MSQTASGNSHSTEEVSARRNIIWVLLIQSSSAFPSSLPLQEIEEKQINPELYPYGSRGPVGAHYLAAKYGVRWGDIVNVDEHTEDRL